MNKNLYYLLFAVLAIPIGFLIGLTSSEIASKTIGFLLFIISSLFIVVSTLLPNGSRLGNILEQPRKLLACIFFVWPFTISIVFGILTRTHEYFAPHQINIEEWSQILTPLDSSITVKYDAVKGSIIYDFDKCTNNQEIIRLIVRLIEFNTTKSLSNQKLIYLHPNLKSYTNENNNSNHHFSFDDK